MVIDVGTGDGRAVLRRARREPASLVVGVDSEATRLRDASRRAARAARKGGLPNALFLLAAAETLPGPLRGAADLVTVVLPWGSLLARLVSAEREMVTSLRDLLRPDGQLELLLSVGPRDRATGISELDGSAIALLAGRFEECGLYATAARPATAADVALLSSSWAKRLGIPDRRQAWLLEFRAEPATAELAAGEGTSHGHAAATPRRLSDTRTETPDR